MDSQLDSESTFIIRYTLKKLQKSKKSGSLDSPKHKVLAIVLDNSKKCVQDWILIGGKMHHLSIIQCTPHEIPKGHMLLIDFFNSSIHSSSPIIRQADWAPFKNGITPPPQPCKAVNYFPVSMTQQNTATIYYTIYSAPHKSLLFWGFVSWQSQVVVFPSSCLVPNAMKIICLWVQNVPIIQNPLSQKWLLALNCLEGNSQRHF